VSILFRRGLPLLRIVAGMAVLFTLVSARVIYSGEAEIAAGTRALQSGQVREAIACSARAAEWYVPAAPHVKVAYGRLIRIAEAAEEHRRHELALVAWRSLRAAAKSTRWLYSPYESEGQRANRAIARLMALGSIRPKPPAGLQQEYLQELMRDETPRVPYVLLLLFGLGAFCMGTIVAVKRMAGSFGELKWRAGRTPLLVALLGVAAWLLALWRA
jgi:hypothetical protein